MKRVIAIVLAIILTTGLVGAITLWGIKNFKEKEKEEQVEEEYFWTVLKKDKKIDSLERELEYSKELVESLQLNKKSSYYFYDMNQRRYFCMGGIVVVKKFTNDQPPELFEDWTEDVEIATY
jgi:predicted RNase H-like nuclease (RuvC/YqgF family)